MSGCWQKYLSVKQGESDFEESEPFQKVAHQKVGHSADGVDQNSKVVASVIFIIFEALPLSFFQRRQNLEQELLGEGEAGEVLQAGDREDQHQRLVHLRLADWNPQLFLGCRKHLGDGSTFLSIGNDILFR